MVELALVRALRPPGSEELAVPGELLDSVVEAVDDVQVVVGVERDPGGSVELPIAVAKLTPVADRRALGVVSEDPVVEGVGAPDGTVAGEREALGPPEVAGAHLSEELILDPMLVDFRAEAARARVLGQADVGDVHGASGRHRDWRRVGVALRADKVPDRVVEMPGAPGDGGGQHGGCSPRDLPLGGGVTK